MLWFLPRGQCGNKDGVITRCHNTVTALGSYLVLCWFSWPEWPRCYGAMTILPWQCWLRFKATHRMEILTRRTAALTQRARQSGKTKRGVRVRAAWTMSRHRASKSSSLSFNYLLLFSMVFSSPGQMKASCHQHSKKNTWNVFLSHLCHCYTFAW